MIKYYPATPEFISDNGDFQKRRYDYPSAPGLSKHEVHIIERFPDGGYKRNDICNLSVRVLKGKDTRLFIRNKDGTEVEDMGTERGSDFEIPRGTPYYFTTAPSSVLYIISTPPWTDEQSKTVTP